MLTRFYIDNFLLSIISLKPKTRCNLACDLEFKFNGDIQENSSKFSRPRINFIEEPRLSNQMGIKQ